MNQSYFEKILVLAKSRVINTFRLDLNTDYHNTVLLSSLGRSGSTLVSNIINYKNEYRIIFEPFKYERLKFVSHLPYPTYISPYDNSKEIADPMDKILRGKIRTWWTDKPNEKLFANKRLIKDIRTNLMLEWIKNNYPEIPIILLIRNPFAAIESWTRSGWDYINPKKRTLEQRSILEPLLPANVLDKYEAAEEPLLNHFYNWCINYYIPLNHFKAGEIHVSYYENYLQNPSAEIKKLFFFLNKPFNKEALNKLDKFSFTTRKDSPLKKGENMILSWKGKYTDVQIADYMDVLSQFGLNNLYDYYESGLPLTNFDIITQPLSEISEELYFN